MKAEVENGIEEAIKELCHECIYQEKGICDPREKICSAVARRSVEIWMGVKIR